MNRLRVGALAVAVLFGTGPGEARQKTSSSPMLDLLDQIRVEPRDVRALIARGADVQAPAGYGQLTPLVKAIDRAGGPFEEDSDLAIVRILIAAGADASTSHGGETPLCKAIGSRRPEDLVVILLRARADPNVPCGSDTPLGKAVLYRSVEVATMLLEAGARRPSVDGKINEERVLHKAAIYGPARMVALLVRHGAPVDERSFDQATPLTRATNVDVAKVLIAAGADVHARDRSGRSVLAVHVQAGHAEIAAFLRARGAREETAPAPGPVSPSSP